MGRITLDSAIFNIDAAAYTARLCEFIAERKASLRRDGILVPLSGGLDSSTVMLLCARAVGPEQVTALLMPEKQGNPQAGYYAQRISKQFNIKTLTRDISPILSRLGTYPFATSLIPRALQDWAVRRYLKSINRSPFLQIIDGTAGAFERQGYARFNSKHRIRAVVAYLLAEEMNYMVVGCAHKSEDMLGLFVKFGVDDSADLMPLKNLYRSQILQLAAYLGVPPEILSRTPNPDIIPGVNDKYMDILGMPSEILDLILYGIEHGMADAEIGLQLGLPTAKIEQTRNLVEQTTHMRHPSQTVKWE